MRNCTEKCMSGRRRKFNVTKGDFDGELSWKYCHRSGLHLCKCCGENGCFNSRRRLEYCILQGDRAVAPVFRPLRFSRMRLTAHLCTHSSNHSHRCGRVDQQEVVRSGRGGGTGARAVHGRLTAGLRPVYGRSRFVTGALAAVKRPQAAKGGLERPLWDTKGAAAT